MVDDGSESDACSFCGSKLPSDPTGEDQRSFCSRGCRDVHATLGNGSTTHPKHQPTEGTPTERDVLYLRVDGMHSRTCEAYLESIAADLDGAIAAEASYVTETVRVEYDDETLSRGEIRDAVSTLGYTAYFRDELGDADDSESGRTRRSREMDGIRKRRTDEILGMRYAAGVLFGAFLMLPYVALLYPAHIASMVAWGPLEIFEGAFEFDATGGMFFLRTYFVLTGIVLLFTGMPVLRGAYTGLKLRRPNTDLLVAVTVVGAYAYSTVAVLVGRTDVFYDLVVIVAAVVTTASFYESTVKQRALDRLTDLTVSSVDTARTYDSDGTTTVDVETLQAGAEVLVRQGERVPVDGELVNDECIVDESVVTGESRPIVKRVGADVVGGSIVTEGAAIVRVGERATSSIDRLTTAVWNLQSATHGVERRADRLVGRVVVPLFAAAIIAAGGAVALGVALPEAGLTFLTVLLVGSPWVLGLATPLSVATSLEEALERGIVVFDETVFERLRETDTVVFDKTGTLTTGTMEVLEADAPSELLAAAGALETLASHPAAVAITAAYADEEAEGCVSEFRTHATGVEGVVDGSRVLVGTVELFADRGWDVNDEIERRVAAARDSGQLPVVVGRGGAAEGYIVVGDEPRPGWGSLVTRLGERGTDVVVLTGDDEEAAATFADHPDVTHVFSGVSPSGKTATIRRLEADGAVAMVGDGTNDAPALAAADLGISMGSATSLAADAADVAIADDRLRSVETAFDLASAARRRVVRNNGLALVYNAIVIPIAIAGLLNPVTAALAVGTSCGLIALNCSRSLL